MPVRQKTKKSQLKLGSNDKNLIRRYLIWCYKTTKEDLDRIDRYFTQDVVDQHLLNSLSSKEKASLENTEYKVLVDGFEKYMKEKLTRAQINKFGQGNIERPSAKYLYLQKRFEAITKAIVYFLGKKSLNEIEALYEQEMTQRILQAREHT